MMKRMPLALNVIQKKVLCSAEKSSVIWAKPHGRSSAEQFFLLPDMAFQAQNSNSTIAFILKRGIKLVSMSTGN